jgi:hypothetical protein
LRRLPLPASGYLGPAQAALGPAFPSGDERRVRGDFTSSRRFIKSVAKSIAT